MMLDDKDLAPLMEKLIAQTGLLLDWRLETIDENTSCLLFPSEIHQAEGFRVEVTPGWKSIESTFIPGNLARELIHDMEHASEEKKFQFSCMTTYIGNAGGNVKMEINTKQMPPDKPEKWPEGWRQLRIVARSKPVESDLDLRIDPTLPVHIYEWTSLFLSALMLLLPLEEIDEDDFIDSNQIEGIRKTTISNRYERSPANRMACIAIHGSVCKICGLDFGKVYGEIGEGFIHVHHLKPVSKAGVGGMIIDPSKDLIPVCPNCHSMLHRRDPPFSIEELEKMIKCK